MNKKKGFTLVEILGIIIILSIVLIIAVPRILDVINVSSKKAFTSDVNELVGASQLEYNEKLEENRQDIWYYFSDGKQENYVEGGELHFKGNKPSSGYILVTKDGKIELELVSSNGKWCASKELEDKNPTIDKCEVKEKEPITLRVNNTTKSITIIVIPTNLDTYYYKLDNGEYESSTSNIQTYNGLDNNKTYTITVKGCRENETGCEEKKITVTLPDFEKPKYNIISLPSDQTSTNEWATSRKVTIDYSQPEGLIPEGSKLVNQYIYANTDEELIKQENNNAWIECQKDKCSLPEFTNDTHIISRITDGYNVRATSMLTLTKFDTEKPTTPVITGGGTSWTSDSRTISVTTESKAKSGIKGYEYYVSTSSETPTDVKWTPISANTISQKFTTHGIHYIFFRAQSNVGLYSEPSNYQIVKIDTSGPILTLGTISTTYNSITIPINTNSDLESDISNTICKLGTTSENYTITGTINSEKTSCTATGLSQNTKYYYKIVTTNGVKISSTISENVTTKIRVFNNGDAVYFNPITMKKCNSSEAVSTRGNVEGCMKWYVFLDDSSKQDIYVILDHSIANDDYSSDLSNSYINEKINTFITNWDSQLKLTARFLSLEEVYTLSGNSALMDASKETYLWDDFTMTSEYSWLYDNMYIPPETPNSPISTREHCYWLADTNPSLNKKYHYVARGGWVSSWPITDMSCDVRLVVTINKSILD